MTQDQVGWACLLLSLAMIGLYEAWTLRPQHTHPERTARSAHAQMRAVWAAELADKPGFEVVAVQTLRHSLMSATITASTAVRALMGSISSLADAAMSQVQGVLPAQVDGLLVTGAIALDSRDKDEHDADHSAASLHVSRGKLEMNIESAIPALDTVILCYCNAHNRGALSAAALRGMGYTNTRYIAGGLKAYRALT